MISISLLEILLLWVICLLMNSCLGCGHCKQLAPVYEQLGQTYKNEPNCVVARVDADGHRDVASRWVQHLSLMFHPIIFCTVMVLVVTQLSSSSLRTTRME